MSVKLEVKGAILEITLDRPKANAIDAATSQSLYEAFCFLRDSPTLRVAILTAAGERFFSAGWDLKAAASGAEAPDMDYGPGGFAGLTTFWNLTKPVICAVNGLAIAGGFELVLAADLVIAADHIEFGLSEVNVGLVADSGGVQRLPRRLPRVIANEMLLTGRRMSAQEAARWGLINQVTSSADLMPAARQLAQTIANAAPLSVAAIKAIQEATEGLSTRESFAMTSSGKIPEHVAMQRSEDAKEGAIAFTQRRPPVWQGK